MPVGIKSRTVLRFVNVADDREHQHRIDLDSHSTLSQPRCEAEAVTVPMSEDVLINKQTNKTKRAGPGGWLKSSRLTSECFFLEDNSRVVSYMLSTKFLRQGTFTSFFTAWGRTNITLNHQSVH